jgi:peptidoglycan/xylan/chitin deacetylase (PgdA/CDA1 family)/glycosyltransferase involved in cell wall biosynthesis
MRILHVFSADFLAGSVFYALQLAESHTAQGHQVFLVSDKDTLPTQVPQYALPIANRKHWQRYKNIRFLKKFIKQHDIQVVHAHSRAASWVSYFAVLGTKIPLISTVHGRQHIHASVQLFDIYGDKVIAICENLQNHLVNEVKMQSEKTTLLANGFNFDKLSSFAQVYYSEIHTFEESKEDPQKNTIISFIGRHNGGKGEIITHLLEQVFPNLLEKYNSLIINLIGGELSELPPQGQEKFKMLNQKFSDRIKSIGFVNDVQVWIKNSNLVIGAGRVAIEALYLGTPVLALGEATCHGIVNEENLQACLASNFGDILPTKEAHKHDYAIINEAITNYQLLENQQQTTNKEQETRNKKLLEERYNIEHIANRVLAIYQSEIIKKVHPKFIPILMYHKIPDQPIHSPNKIFVTKENFEKHLRFFKLRGLSPITFKDYWAFRKGEKALKDFPKKPIILTFDDGYTDNYTNLLPLMQKYSYRGVIYLLGDFAVNHNFWDVANGDHRDEIMSKAQKKVFVEKGWEIGSHTLTHRHLTQLSENEIFEEVLQAKLNLEKELGTEIISFAYPYGDLDEKVKAQVQKTGHQLGIATDSGGMGIEEDLFQVFRINMFPNESVFQLYKKTSSWYRAYYKKKRGK